MAAVVRSLLPQVSASAQGRPPLSGLCRQARLSGPERFRDASPRTCRGLGSRSGPGPKADSRDVPAARCPLGRVVWPLLYRDSDAAARKSQPASVFEVSTGEVSEARLPTVDQVPWLLALWDPAANAPLKSSDIKAGEHRRLVAWRCAKGHTWQRRPRTQKPDCGYCSGRELLIGLNDLATVNPALAAQWHPTKNGDLTPDQVLPMSNLQVSWRGPCGDEWEARIANRSNGSGCRGRHEGTRVTPSCA